MEPERRLRSLAWMKPRLLPGVRCSTLNTVHRSLPCITTMPGRSWVAGMYIGPKLSPYGMAREFPLVEPEVDFDVDLHGHGLAVLLGRLELPGAHRLDGFLIQSQAEGALHADVAGPAVGAHHHEQHHRPLILGLAGLLRVFRIGREDGAGRAHSAAHAIDAAADAAAPSRSYARPAARTHAAPRTRADAAAEAGPVRWRAYRGHGIAQRSRLWQ